MRVFRISLLLAIVSCGSEPEVRTSASFFPDPQPGTVEEIELADSSAVLKMVYVPGGEFHPLTRLADARDPSGQCAGEEIAINEFWMARYETTVRQFRAFVEETGYRTRAERQGSALVRSGDGRFVRREGISWKTPGFSQEDRLPVVCVNPMDAEAFVDWLNGESTDGFGIPGELELEFACRGGRVGPWGFSGGPERLEEYGWFSLNSNGGPHPAGRKRVPHWGLFDMHGNVAEWVHAGANVFPNGNPKAGRGEPGALSGWVVRGGAWYRDAEECSCVSRAVPSVDSGRTDVGFRVVWRP